MKISKNSHIQIISFIFLISFFFSTSYTDAARKNVPLTVKTYCQLSIELMKVTLDDWKIKTSLLKQYRKDPEALNREMSKHDYAYKKKRNDLYKAYNTTFPEYSRFNSRNQKEIKEYLQEYIAVKTKRDNLSKAIEKQMKIYDAVEAYLMNQKK